MGGFALRKEEAASLLGNRAFLRLAIAQFGATVAVYGLSFAGVALVEERTHSTAQTGLVIASSILPAFLASLVAGAAVDRWGRGRWCGRFWPSPSGAGLRCFLTAWR